MMMQVDHSMECPCLLHDGELPAPIQTDRHSSSCNKAFSDPVPKQL